MNSDTLILRSTTNPPLTNKNDYLTPTDFDGNFIKIYDDLLSLCVTTGVIAYNASTTYDDDIVQYATYGGRLWSWVNASPGSAITPGTNALYWSEIFPSQLSHRMNSDTILSEGTADEVTAAEIRAFIDGGLTTTTNLAVTEQTDNSLKITSSTGTDAVLTEATLSLAGLLSANDKATLVNTSGNNTGDQTLASLGAEDVTNKAIDFSTINDTLYPSVQAVSAEITSQVAALAASVDNMATADLTFTGNRSHNTDGNDLLITTDGVGAQSVIYMTPTELLFSATGGTRFGGALSMTYNGLSGNYTLDDTDYIYDCTAGTSTATLPTAVGRLGRTYVIKNSGAGVLTLEGDGTETIDGVLKQTLNQYDSITVVSNGANWIMV